VYIYIYSILHQWLTKKEALVEAHPEVRVEAHLEVRVEAHPVVRVEAHLEVSKKAIIKLCHYGAQQ